MKEIVLNGSGWKTKDDFYSAFLAEIGAPDWHGHNLDALHDSIGGRGINKFEPPFTVRIHGTSAMSLESKQMVERFQQLIVDLRQEGIQVAIQMLP